MASAAARGQRAKEKTAHWFVRQGYCIAWVERVFTLWTPKGLVRVKRDQLGADIVAISRQRVVLVQVKSGQARPSFAPIRREFAKYPLAPGCEQWIVFWSPRVREPEVEVVAVGPQPGDHPVTIPPRKKAVVLPLFARPG